MGLFKRKSPLEKLYAQHKDLLAQAHNLSTSNRTASDQKVSEAEALLKKIIELEAKGS